MNLSKETLALIKNFSGINGSILLQPGNRLATISEGRNIMAEATIPEEFPQTFGIYDLNEFLNAVNIFTSPQILSFKNQYVLITDGDSDSKIKYFGTGEGIVKETPATINFPNPEIEFFLDDYRLATIIKTASVLKTNDISIVGDKNTSEIMAVVSDKKNDTANSYDVVLGKGSVCNMNFRVNFKLDSLKLLMPGTYDVWISSKRISRFTHTTLDLRYFVAVETDSTFDE